MDITINWQKDNKWIDFDMDSINHLPRNHAIDLFSGKIPVIAKQGDDYIVNTMDLLNRYKSNKKSVVLFESLERSEKPLSEVGLI